MNASGGLARIRGVLKDIAGGKFAPAARSLLAELGYRSDRTLSDQTSDVNQFIERYPARKAGTQSSRVPTRGPRRKPRVESTGH